MRFLYLLLPFLLIVGAQNQEQTESVTDLFNEVLEVEESLKAEIQQKINDRKAKFDEVSTRLKESIKAMDEALKQKKQKAEEAMQKIKDEQNAKKAAKEQQQKELQDELKLLADKLQEKKKEKEAEREQRVQEMIQGLKDAYEKRKQEKEAEQQKKKQDFLDKIDAAIQKWNDFKTKFEQAKKEKEEKRKQKLEETQRVLGELKELVKAEVQKREQEKEARETEQEQLREKFRGDIKAQNDVVNQTRQDLLVKYEEYKEQSDILKKQIQDAIRQDMKAKMTNKYAEKLQNALDKEAIKAVLKNHTNEDGELSLANQQATVQAEGKATILDEITGTSQWQTVTWILLALAIILAVALVAMIFHQMQQNKHYQRLEGHDLEEHESTPIARPIPPYTVAKIGTVDPSTSVAIPMAGPPELSKDQQVF